MSLRNGMWHGLRNDIIMRNLIYADHFQRNKLDKCLNAWTSKAVVHSNWRQKRRGNDARMPFSLIYFFAPVSIFYILHNYVIPQAMPHAIPQTHSVFYPHRPQRFYLPLSVGLHGNTDTTSRDSAIEEKMFWKITLPSALKFSANDVCTINFAGFLHLFAE